MTLKWGSDTHSERRIPATSKQRDCIEALMKELGYDKQDLDIALYKLTKLEASRLIEQLRRKVEG